MNMDSPNNRNRRKKIGSQPFLVNSINVKGVLIPILEMVNLMKNLCIKFFESKKIFSNGAKITSCMNRQNYDR